MFRESKKLQLSYYRLKTALEICWCCWFHWQLHQKLRGREWQPRKGTGSLKWYTETVGSTRCPGSKMIYMFQALGASEGTLPIQDMERRMELVLFLYSFLGSTSRMLRHTHTHPYHTTPPFSMSPAGTGVRINSIKPLCRGKEWKKKEVTLLHAVKGSLSWHCMFVYHLTPPSFGFHRGQDSWQDQH